MEHLVYCDAKAKVLAKILEGSKTMIVRGAAGRKLPYGRVFEGETLYFIENSGEGLIKAKAKVKSVINSEKMTEEESKALVLSHQSKLNLTEAQFSRWAGKKFLCLIEIEKSEPITPLRLDRQKNMDDWIAVESIASVLEGTSEKYQSVSISD